ncbi:MAG: hypothetical protein LBV15_06040 [Planctomycetota bacterium]|nr:hypothetical protein [Planctomycetota bacterium]
MPMNADEAREGEKLDFGSNWDDKIRLMEAIDNMREEARRLRSGEFRPLGAAPDGSLAALQEKLRIYENTCAMLEREVQTLEQQTLAALAEAGRLRRELDRRESMERTADPAVDSGIRKFMAESENERRLLLDALENSEAELARMVKTLDLVARKLQVA